MIQEAFASKMRIQTLQSWALGQMLPGLERPYICLPDKSQKHLIACIGQSITKL